MATPNPVMSSRRNPLVAAAAAVCLVAVMAACEPPGPTSATATTTPASCRGTGTVATKNVAYKSVAGVDPNLLSLDYYKPVRPTGCGPAPLVIFTHGGGFRIGDKANKIDDKVKLFNDEGWVFASINYRLSTSPANDPAPIRYPTHEQDAAAAVAWLKNHSSTLGVDPTRILLVGHSSGAFITSLLSTDTSFLTAAGVPISDVPCAVSLDTEYDITTQVAQGGQQEALYRNAFGDDPAVWAEGSPINHTAKGQPRPKFLIYTQGPTRRTDQARNFGSALVAGGTPATVFDVSPLEHDQINAAVGAPGDTKVTPPLMDFLRGCAAPSSK